MVLFIGMSLVFLAESCWGRSNSVECVVEEVRVKAVKKMVSLLCLRCVFTQPLAWFHDSLHLLLKFQATLNELISC